ncbi:DUF4242 domain-containing protein [Ensifer sp. HO-A22]|uniref:DUF4242 domain-containing protein n=1 Tax=Ensifer oleiphilus TaxID=2742698 RepID=A0A7Y6UPI5_9HYPH|nr:DUF4242 domain-containing protein [Ensifer oleiphilus]NVD41415.1 DUF4242 domain-containing protein [Ensifer oleiphilus]
MPTFIIERDVPGADKLSQDDLCAISAKSNAVVADLGVPYTWITSYVAGDKIYCVHEAPSADVIREHAERGGFPANRITEVAAVIGPSTASQGNSGK